VTADKIVVIDDSRLYRGVLKKALSEAGYQVETAADGKAGVDLVIGLLPDLVVTDMDMPVMCGEEVCRRLKAEATTQMIPIIMLTANRTTDKITQLDAGADDYIPKSNDLAELLAKVRVFLRIKHLQDKLREQNEKLRYENELNELELSMAREVQRGLLPREGGRRGRLHLAFHYVPMRWVGGDLFDVLADEQGNTLFFVSDVSGHGVGAALITAMFKTSILGQVGRVTSVVDLVNRVNAAISSLMDEGRFVTAFLGLLDSHGDRIQYVNAGHPPGLLLRRGEDALQRLDSTETPFGIMDEMSSPHGEIPVSPGDRLILYTDGITEATDQAGTMFGMPRFEASVLAHRHLELEPFVAKVIEDLTGFCGRSSFDDDVNLVVCEVLEA
jgi:two-component system sensor histidine kinase ChiS